MKKSFSVLCDLLQIMLILLKRKVALWICNELVPFHHQFLYQDMHLGGLLLPKVLGCVTTQCSSWKALSGCFHSLAKGNICHHISNQYATLFFFQYSLLSLCLILISQQFQLWYFHCAFCFISGFVFYFILFYFLEHFKKFLGVFSASVIGIA